MAFLKNPPPDDYFPICIIMIKNLQRIVLYGNKVHENFNQLLKFRAQVPIHLSLGWYLILINVKSLRQRIFKTIQYAET